jgi:hypothetical protein
MGGVFGTRDRKENCMDGFVRKTSKERDCLEGLGVGIRKILKCILKN